MAALRIALLVLQVLLGLSVACSWVYYVLCLDSARRWARQRGEPPSDFTPPVSILKPLRGSDPEQYENFASFCRLDYPTYELLFGALEPADPGLETARRLQSDFPGRDIRIVAGHDNFGLNRKVCNLEGLHAGARYKMVVLCDSDMRVEPNYLRRVVAPFADPKVGLVTCLYRGHRARNLPSILEALGIGADFAPSVLLTNRLWGMGFALGSTIAIRSEALESIGGFRPLANEIADDYLLGSRTKAAGWGVALSDYVVDDVLGREPFGEMWTRRLRWAKTVRAMQPAGWAGSFVTHGTALAILFLAASRFAPLGWAALAATLIVRGLTATLIARRCTHDENLPRRLALLPVSDLVSFGLWAASFFGRHVVWRGERFRLERGGRLTRAELTSHKRR